MGKQERTYDAYKRGGRRNHNLACASSIDISILKRYVLAIALTTEKGCWTKGETGGH